MKDLEKIKSEDLAAQVQDANPGNFAIEQEVAAMVGATVPQPTEPSADDARELGAQLLVFLRRALTPIQTALRTAVAAIYAHLDSRCTDYTPAAYAPYRILPYDPMTTPRAPRSVANLLTALTAFSDRKISNGSAPSDGIPDGISLAHLLCSTDAANAVTEIVDDNTGWVANKTGWLSALLAAFPGVKKVYLNCRSITAYPMSQNTSVSNCEIHLATKDLNFDQGNVNNNIGSNVDIWLDELETCNVRAQGQATFRATRLFFPIFKHGTYSVGGSAGWTNGNTQYIYFGCKGKTTDTITLTNAAGGSTGSTQALAMVELRQGARQPITFGGIPSWDCYPNLTAENIVSGIFDKLADNTDGAPITINIGSTNLAKLTDEQKAIAQNKNYTLV